ncbi:MAG TPA: outer membrane beta-barrel protein [Candidatus Kapabacteria bacterium]|jgi:hypothetical protein
MNISLHSTAAYRLAAFRLVAVPIILIAIFSTASRSQTGATAEDSLGQTAISKTIYGLGLNFSTLSGLGVSGKIHFDHHLSAMVTGYVSKSSDETYYNLGLELQYDLMVRDRTRLYAMAGYSHWYDNSGYDSYDDGYVYSPPATDHFGAGFGLELNFISDDLCIDGSVALVSNQPSGDLTIYPAIGTHYYFW